MYVNAGLLPHARDLIPRNCKKLLSFGGNKKLLSFGGNKKLLPFGSSFFTLPTMPFSGLNPDPHQNDFRRINKQRVKRPQVWRF